MTAVIEAIQRRNKELMAAEAATGGVQDLDDEERELGDVLRNNGARSKFCYGG